MDCSAEARLAAEPSRLLALEEKLRELEKRLTYLEGQAAEDRVALVVFSGDLDRVLAAFIIATGAAAMGQQVSMFFTFWGLSVLKKDTQLSGKDPVSKNDGADVSGVESKPACLADELLWGRIENAACHDESEERQFARGADVAREGTRCKDGCL